MTKPDTMFPIPFMYFFNIPQTCTRNILFQLQVVAFCQKEPESFVKTWHYSLTKSQFTFF